MFYRAYFRDSTFIPTGAKAVEVIGTKRKDFIKEENSQVWASYEYDMFLHVQKIGDKFELKQETISNKIERGSGVELIYFPDFEKKSFEELVELVKVKPVIKVEPILVNEKLVIKQEFKQVKKVGKK